MGDSQVASHKNINKVVNDRKQPNTMEHRISRVCKAAESFLSNLLPHVQNTGDSHVASLACMVM